MIRFLDGDGDPVIDFRPIIKRVLVNEYGNDPTIEGPLDRIYDKMYYRTIDYIKEHNKKTGYKPWESSAGIDIGDGIAIIRHQKNGRYTDDIDAIWWDGLKIKFELSGDQCSVKTITLTHIYPNVSEEALEDQFMLFLLTFA